MPSPEPPVLPAASLDALLPPDMARKAEEIGTAKVNMSLLTTFVLAVLAGAFIALGAVFMTTVVSGLPTLPFGFTRLFAGLAFSLGLVLVVVGGAELFTGNNLIVMAWADGRVKTSQVVRNWGVVYAGNFVGAVATAGMMVVTENYRFGNGAVGAAALGIAVTKVKLGFVQAMALGVLCNALVCLAVWLSFSARTTTDRVMCIVPPITAFVACGFEHSIANMYLVPYALFIPTDYWTSVGATPPPNLTWEHFLAANLLPVTIGNLIGGVVLVGLVYWLVYVRLRKG